MGSLSTGGGSSAVAASAHAGCERHRLTDPMVIGMSRRALADKLGHPDTSAGIPEARWMRAMTFERLVQDQRFVSQLLTTAVGALGLRRPPAVHRADAGTSVDRTRRALGDAHKRAIDKGDLGEQAAWVAPFWVNSAWAYATFLFLLAIEHNWFHLGETWVIRDMFTFLNGVDGSEP